MLTRQAELGCELPQRLATKVGMHSQQRSVHHRPLATHNKLRASGNDLETGDRLLVAGEAETHEAKAEGQNK